MLIDFHTHTFPHKLAGKVVKNFSQIRSIPTPTPECLYEHLHLAGVQRAVNLPVAFRPDTVSHVNDFAFQLQSPTYLTLAAIHPDSPDVLEQLEELKHQGVKGVKLHPELQVFDFEDPKYKPLYNKIGDLGLITVIHSGLSFSKKVPQLTPKVYLPMAAEFKGAPVVLAHMGGTRITEEESAIAMDLPVYVDTSLSTLLIQPDDFLRQLEGFGVERVLFGSDFPYALPEDMLTYLEALPLTPEERQAIYCDNAIRLLDWPV